MIKMSPAILFVIRLYTHSIAEHWMKNKRDAPIGVPHNLGGAFPCAIGGATGLFLAYFHTGSDHVETGQTNYGVNNTRYDGAEAEDGVNQIPIEETYQTPIDRTDNHEHYG